VAGIVALVAPEAELMILRAFDSDGMASSFDVASALRYAVDFGATVINLSCSSGARDEIVADAIAYARSRGVTIVVAAGNDNLELPAPYPASDPQVLSVAATDLNDTKAKFSNFGNNIACMAPGTGLFSIFPGGEFAAWSGTSFAAPWVTACLALLRAGEMANERAAIEAIRSGAVNISRRNPAYIGKLGAGRISIGNALKNFWNKKQELQFRNQAIARFRSLGSRTPILGSDF
jgi:subtilisin family serine protease